ncbi:MAG TPA: YbaK/EbsC family protein [Polyangia bacterium]|nr:YbaK/EbsC family protein [Polyangia bacterium]
MIASKIVRHMEQAGVKVVVRPHPRVVAAQRLAASVHVSGYRVAKVVLVEADGERMMAVLPAAEIVDPARLAAALGAERVRILHESEFLDLFTECEPGAEPPFGALYGLPVVMDRRLAHSSDPLVFRAGSHEEALEMKPEDFVRMEHPRLADFAVLAPSVPNFEDERWV